MLFAQLEGAHHSLPGLAGTCEPGRKSSRLDSTNYPGEPLCVRSRMPNSRFDNPDGRLLVTNSSPTQSVIAWKRMQRRPIADLSPDGSWIVSGLGCICASRIGFVRLALRRVQLVTRGDSLPMAARESQAKNFRSFKYLTSS
jgi:hypothetical protein